MNKKDVKNLTLPPLIYLDFYTGLVMQNFLSVKLHTISYPSVILGAKMVYLKTGLQIRVRFGRLFSLLLIQNICCGYFKEPTQ